MKLTEFQRKVLLVLSHEEITYAHQLADIIWPDSPAWLHSKNGGRGGAKGAGMPRAAAVQLARMTHKGLVTWGGYGDRYLPTPLGYELLGPL